MSKIKTREIAEKGIKTLDKAAIVSERMKSAYIRTREQAVDTVASRQESANDYAGDQMEHTAEDFSREVVHDVGSGTQRAVQKGREVFRKQREKAVKKKEQEQRRQYEPQLRCDEASTNTDKPSPDGDVPENTEPAPKPDAVQSITNLSPVPEGVDVPSEPASFMDEAPRTPAQMKGGVGTSPDVEPTVRDDRLPQKVERLPRQTPDEVYRESVDAGKPRLRQSRAAMRNTVSFEPNDAEVMADAPKSPVERGRDLVDKRAEARVESKRQLKGQSTRSADMTPSQIRPERTSVHTPSPASTAEAIEPVQTARRSILHNNRAIRSETVETAEKTTKTTRRTIKTAQQSSKAAVKTAEHTAKTTIKTAEATAKAAQKSAQAAARAEKVAIQTTRASAKVAAVTAKAVAKAVVMAVKATIAAVKSLISALAAGGGVAGIAIVVICLVGLLVGSVFGIFFSGEDSGSGQTMQTAVREINTEYEDKLTEIRTGNPHDILEMSGSRAVWREVLAVYAVKTTTDPDNPQDVASMDDGKKALLKEIFWAMHTVSYTTVVETRDIATETDDGNGNSVDTSTPTEVAVLYITVTHRTADEMADNYGFTAEQRVQLAELLDGEYQNLWGAVLYGIGTGDGQIVEVALAQLGNSGDIYWGWYGFNSRVEWCACFVSWCANECGYIEAGIIPKFSSCSRGVEWFQNHGQWQDNTYVPRPGDIIFFDWDKQNKGQDGVSDHVGIVEKVENGYVYTVEGNSSDRCRENRYTVENYQIIGYGTSAY